MGQQPRFRHLILRLDRLFQNVAHGAKEFCQRLVVEVGDFGRRMHPGVEKNFVGVNVPNPCDQLLIHQNRFHRAAMFCEHLFEFHKIEIERIRAQYALF